MLAALGTAAVTLGFVAALAGIVSFALGLLQDRPTMIRAGRVYALLTFVGAAAAFVIMEVALLTDDFSLVYVADTSARATPLLYKIATLWAALEGSIILWVLVLTGFTVATVVAFRRQADDQLVSVALLVQLVVVAFFFGLMVGPGPSAGTAPATCTNGSAGPTISPKKKATTTSWTPSATTNSGSSRRRRNAQTVATRKPVRTRTQRMIEPSSAAHSVAIL